MLRLTQTCQWTSKVAAVAIFCLPIFGFTPAFAQKKAATDQAEATVEIEPLFQWSSSDEEADSQWEFKDKEAWKFKGKGDDRVLSQFAKPSSYQPPFRSPTHMALLKDQKFKSFQLDVDIKSTHSPYGHRDVCLFFGYTSPSQFYYVHMAQEADPRANQIFIVNEADRVKISSKTTKGTAWTDDWHHVRILRDVEAGTIEVYFDDMNTPAMTATDKNFKEGRIGFGSFDDTADFRKLTVRPLKSTK